jgi:hypothetical protein
LVGKGRKITALKVAKLSRLAYLFLHLKKRLAGQIFHEEEEVKKISVLGCVHRRRSSMTSENKTLYPG